MTDPLFSPGFRLSSFDILILIVGSAAAVIFASKNLWLGLAIAFVVAHFFLFCNVIRMSRPLELIWAAAFILLAIFVIATGMLSWPITFILSALLTLILATIEVRKPSYHGVGWKKLNPHLTEWWNQHANKNE
ncbi:MAG TPA: hypothetical protein VHS31_02805 [Tepidisphaeraceae bacterium]|nr:hypothetical protein [Tepidisphaeraceae bacterium]